MRRTTTCFLLLLITPLLVLLQSAKAQAAWPGPDVARSIDALVTQVMKESRIPGLAVGIVEGDQAVYLKGYGTAGGGRPVTPQTPFILGSLSKSFTAMAAQQLVAAGKLDLDRPVQYYLPWFRVADEAASAKITVRDLLNHTTGLPREAANFLGAVDDRTSAESIVRRMAELELTAAPGEQFQYCNLNYITAALIVERISGVPFDQYISRQILAPLGMTHSFTNEPAAMADGMATGHLYLGTLPVRRHALYSRAQLGSGSMIASAEDMTRYLRAIMHGGTLEGATVLPPERVNELFTAAVPTGPGRGASSYGLGWSVSAVGGEPLYEHDGETPTFRSAMAILPGQSRALVILTNATTDPTAGVIRLRDALVAVLRDQMGFLTPATVPASAYVKLLFAPVLVLIQLWDLFRLGAWRRQVRTRSTRWTDWAPVAGNLAMAAICLVAVPRAFDATYRLMWAVFPSLTVVILGTGALALAVLAYRTLLLLRQPRQLSA